MNYRELRRFIRKTIKETSLLPGQETPVDLNPAYKRNDWHMATMKPNQHIAFNVDNVDEDIFDEFLNLFGNKIEWSGDWMIASPETTNFAKKFIEREGGIFNQAPEEIVDWIIRNPNNNIVVEGDGFMGGSGSDGQTTDNTNSSDEEPDDPENVAEDKKDTDVKTIAKDIEAKGVDKNTASAVALGMAAQPGADTENPHGLVSGNADLLRKLGLSQEDYDELLKDPKFIEAVSDQIKK